MPTPKKELFISHIAVEAELALLLKEQIESAFAHKCHAFVSSSPDDIKAGEKWFDQVSDSLKRSTALLTICSRTSIKSPWLFFEAGFAMSRDLKILPICHGGLAKDNLMIPLALSNALQLSSPGFSQNLISALAAYLRLRPAPRINYKKMTRDLQRCADSASFKVEILRTMEGRFYRLCTVSELSATLETDEDAMKKHLSFLKDADYLKSKKLADTREDYYALTPKARRLLQVGYITSGKL